MLIIFVRLMKMKVPSRYINCLYTVYTIHTALHCFKHSRYILLGKVRTLLEWAIRLLSNMYG